MQKDKRAMGAMDRQRAVYLGGVAGNKPRVPVNVSELEAQAHERMSPEAYAYIAGGAGLESTVERNRRGFEAWRIQPRMLRDVSERDTSIELFGKRYAHPFLTAPIGVLEMAHPEADLAVARACAATDTPMIFSNQASRSMEDCARVMGDAPRWFQLYWSKRNELVESFAKRAEDCGCEAIVVTLDTTLLGWRVRDLDLAYLPFLRGKGIAQYTSDPVFQKIAEEPPEGPQPKRKVTLKSIATLFQQAAHYPGGFFKGLAGGRAMKSVQTFINIYSRPSLTWEDLKFLRERTRLPILLKGVHHPADARLAVDHGIDGLIISNHGGRQVDGGVSTIEMLPAIVGAVQDRLPLIVDSGIRGGADAFKCLALGAKAVCIGRPYVYGLAIAGQAGVEEVIANFAADLELTMGLAGCRSIAEIKRDCVTRDAP